MNQHFKCIAKKGARASKHIACKLGYYTNPSFLIIGAQKCGTSALASYLWDHPKIVPAERKEVHYFSRDAAYNQGLPWYCRHFPAPINMPKGAVTFDASPVYIYLREVPERIYAFDAHIKMLLLLRNPIDRAFSSYNMYRRWRESGPNAGPLSLGRRAHMSIEKQKMWESYLHSETFPSFEETIDLEMQYIGNEAAPSEPSCLRRGFYAEQLERYFHYFPRKQFLIIHSADLKNEPPKIMNEIESFLELPHHDWEVLRQKGSSKSSKYREHHGTYYEEMTEETRERLREFYRPYNERLYSLVGEDFGWDK